MIKLTVEHSEERLALSTIERGEGYAGVLTFPGDIVRLYRSRGSFYRVNDEARSHRNVIAQPVRKQNLVVSARERLACLNSCRSDCVLPPPGIHRSISVQLGTYWYQLGR